jgi:hypothetical protein
VFKAVIFVMLIFAGMASGKGPGIASFNRVYPIDSLVTAHQAGSRGAAAGQLRASGFTALDSFRFERRRGTAAAELVVLETADADRLTAVRHELRCNLACESLLAAWWERYRGSLGLAGVQMSRSLVFSAPDRSYQVMVTLDGDDERARLITRAGR